MMKKIISKYILFGVLLSITIFYFLTKHSIGFINIINEGLRFFNRGMIFSLNRWDFLIIALLPLWTIPLFYFENHVTFRKIAFENFRMVSIVIIVIVFFFLFIEILPSSPLIPSNIVEEPFDSFWTIILLLAIIIAHVTKLKYYKIALRGKE